MEDGHGWAISMFGAAGPIIRARIPELVRAEHVASADAQEASGHRSRRVFGQFSFGLLERFEQLAKEHGGTLVHPGRAGYWVPVVNRVALYPWRYGTGQHNDSIDSRFITSDARSALFRLDPPPVQSELDLGMAGHLSDDDHRLVEVARFAGEGDSSKPYCRVVVVGVACSMAGVTDLRWGEVTVRDDGRLAWHETESLMQAVPSRPTGVTRTEQHTFSTGQMPQKALRLQGQQTPSADGDA